MFEFKKVQQVAANNRIASLVVLVTALSLIIFCSYLPSSDDHDDDGQNSRVNFDLSLPPASHQLENLSSNCSELTGEGRNSDRNISVEVHDGIESGFKNGSNSQELEKVTELVNATLNSSPPVIQLKEEAAALESDVPKEETGDGLADTETKRAQIAEFSQCDLYSGKWDSDYTKWRWQPSHCDLPRLNATDLLERMRGKRVMFIGDSINRNQWESMLCILSTVVPPNRKSFGRPKHGGATSFVAQDYNCSFEFFWAPFLIEQGIINSGNSSKEILKLDAIENHGAYWRDVDILVFNSAHWWTHGNKVQSRDFYMEGNYLHPQLDPLIAFKKGLATWANWIDQNIDPAKTKVFFRGFSPMHFSSGQWKKPKGHKCNFEREPILEESYVNPYPERMKMVDEVLGKMKFPVSLINITRLSDFRKDAHPSVYTMREGKKLTAEQRKEVDRFGDCSHWCLPGVPDIWNELFYGKLLMLTQITPSH
ncbi:hypothetical protein SUGI_0251990 [Cryptomeria japonica]|nr:hypothetical protein SUGI_0251990 [Cryptomeria japonica]